VAGEQRHQVVVVTCYWCSREGCDCKQPERADRHALAGKFVHMEHITPADLVDCPTDRIPKESGISRPARSAKATPCDRCGKPATGILVLRDGLSRHYCSVLCHRAMMVPGWPEIRGSTNWEAWLAAVSEPSSPTEQLFAAVKPGLDTITTDEPSSAAGGVGKAAQACCKQAQPVHHHSSRMWDWCPKHGYTNPADGQEPLPPVHLPMPKSMSMPWCGSDSPTDWVTFTREAATCPGCLAAWDLGVSETPRE
jgi:hypothetical protein